MAAQPAPTPSPAEDGLGGRDIAQIATAVSAVVAVLASLAVTGILAKAQRDHGVWLLAGFASVLAGVVCWLLAPLAPRRVAKHRWPQGRWRWPLRAWYVLAAPARWVFRNLFRKRRLQIIALVLFALGLGLGIEALILTQEDGERPAVSVNFNSTTRILKGKATAQDLSADERLAVVVAPLLLAQKIVTENGRKTKTVTFEETPRALYYAIIGPSGDGKVAHEFTVYVPAKLAYVGVRAWTGNRPSTCDLVEVSSTRRTAETAPATARGVARVKVLERYEPGCLALKLPTPKTQAANKKPKPMMRNPKPRTKRPRTEN